MTCGTGVESPLCLLMMVLKAKSKNTLSKSSSRFRFTGSIAFVESADRSDNKKAEEVNSRSGSGQHLMPLRLRAYTERRSEEQREDHDEAYLERTLSGDKIQDGRGSH